MPLYVSQPNDNEQNQAPEQTPVQGPLTVGAGGAPGATPTGASTAFPKLTNAVAAANQQQQVTPAPAQAKATPSFTTGPSTPPVVPAATPVTSFGPLGPAVPPKVAPTPAQTTFFPKPAPPEPPHAPVMPRPTPAPAAPVTPPAPIQPANPVPNWQAPQEAVTKTGFVNLNAVLNANRPFIQQRAAALAPAITKQMENTYVPQVNNANEVNAATKALADWTTADTARTAALKPFLTATISPGKNFLDATGQPIGAPHVHKGSVVANLLHDTGEKHATQEARNKWDALMKQWKAAGLDQAEAAKPGDAPTLYQSAAQNPYKSADNYSALQGRNINPGDAYLLSQSGGLAPAQQAYQDWVAQQAPITTNDELTAAESKYPSLSGIIAKG